MPTDPTDVVREIMALAETHAAIKIHGMTDPPCSFCSLSNIALRLAERVKRTKDRFAGGVIHGLTEASVGTVEKEAYDKVREELNRVQEEVPVPPNDGTMTLPEMVRHMRDENARLKAEVERLETDISHLRGGMEIG